MRKSILLVLAAGLVVSAAAQPSTSISVEELERALAASEDAHQADADVARQLSGMELTERLSTAKLARLKAGLPGEKSEQALVALADSSVFLDPPAAEIPANPTPDPAALRQMLVFGRELCEHRPFASCPILLPRAIRPALRIGR